MELTATQVDIPIKGDYLKNLGTTTKIQELYAKYENTDITLQELTAAYIEFSTEELAIALGEENPMVKAAREVAELEDATDLTNDIVVTTKK